jgi:hypothetical protein
MGGRGQSYPSKTTLQSVAEREQNSRGGKFHRKYQTSIKK